MSDATEDNPVNTAYLKLYGIVLNKKRANPDPSRATGSIGSGHLEKGLNLVPRSGTTKCGGYVEYIPVCQGEPLTYGHWGTATLVRLIENVSNVWRAGHDWPRISVGHMSRQGGGSFTSFCTGNEAHKEHTNGLEVDLRYIRNDRTNANGEAPIDLRNASAWQYFDAQGTKDLVDLFLELGNITVIYVYPGSYSGTSEKITFDEDPHYNHIHVTIDDPDGAN